MSSRSITSSVSLALGLLICLGPPTSAKAQDAAAAESEANSEMPAGTMTEERQLDDEAARQHFRVATRYYEQGRFAESAQQFEEAYELSGRAELLYNAFIAHRDAGAPADAAAMLEQYLQQMPNAPDRANLEARLAQLQASIAESSEQQEALAAARARAEREAAARREAEASPTVWPWVILGVGGAAVIAGAITGPLALDQATALSAQCDATGLCPPETNLEEEREMARSLALISDILLFGGGAVALAGLVLGLTLGLGSDEEDEEGVTPTAACNLDGCQLGLRGAF